MAKHAASDSEDDHSDAHSSAKRPRVDQGSPLPGSSPPPLPSDTDAEAQEEEDEDEEMAPAGPAAAAAGSDDDHDEEEEEEESPEEKRRTQDKIREMHSKKGSGHVAEAGIIEEVQLENFMCHRLTTVNFGPQINFLVGMNGSGKSAVLTGITMALGGNAKATNRAAKGSGFVAEGQTSCKCIVKLRNRGTDAFQHDIYGNSITVERTLRTSGGGSYKLKNHEGHTVDTKKVTLDAMLDHFNIQVDNPMTVLSQDQSRMFLASASPKDKYIFFLRGTQLAQLTEEYEAIRGNTDSMGEALARKREIIPELKDAYRRARDRAKDATAAITQQEKVDAMKNELAWSYVDEITHRITKGEEIVDRESKAGPKTQRELDEATTRKEEAETTIADFEEAQAEVNETIKEYEPKVAELKDQLAKHKSRIQAENNADRQLSGTLSRFQTTIDNYKQDIANEKRRLERDVEAEQRPIRERIEKYENEMGKLVIRQKDANDAGRECETERKALVERLGPLKEAREHAIGDAKKVEERINNFNRMKTNPLTAYGPNVPAFMRAIDQERGWRVKPVGPLGQHVKLVADPRFGKIIEDFFGESLNAFVTTNHEDRAKLFQMHKQHRLDHRVPLIMWAHDPSFDYRNGEPDDPSILTVMRAIKVNNPIAEQVLINSAQPERSALVLRRPQGDQLLLNNPRNVNAAFSADGFILKNKGGLASTSIMSTYNGARRLNPDVSAQIREEQEQLEHIHQAIENINQEKVQLDQQLAVIHRRGTEATKLYQQCGQKLGQLTGLIDTEKAKLQEEKGSNVEALEDALQSAVEEHEATLAQYQAAVEERARNKVDMEPVVLAKNEAEDKLKKAQKLGRNLNQNLEAAISAATDATATINRANKDLAAFHTKIADLQRQVDEIAPILAEREQAARHICPVRPEVTQRKTPARLHQEIETMEKALKAREKQQGASIEQIMEELAVRKKTVTDAVEVVNGLNELILVLEEAYKVRIERWAAFRDQIAARAKLQFLFHLSNRGFTGKLQFDHDKGRLNLRVQTEDANSRSAAKQKDAKSLSGGEKSFSTICLLLTMWEAVGCPLRCLDEFDVFMDAVNRRISMKMMVDTAKAANGVQFILITPQDMGGHMYGPEVRVSKLRDPERGQGTLGMGR